MNDAKISATDTPAASTSTAEMPAVATAAIEQTEKQPGKQSEEQTKQTQGQAEDQIDNSSRLLAVIDEIINIKRRAHSSDRAQGKSENTQASGTITFQDRMNELKRYKLLAELKNDLKGRVLFEYDEGLETLVKEVIV